MWTDPIVEEVRKHRKEHAAKFNYDIDAIYRDIKEREKESGRTYVNLSLKQEEKERKQREVLSV